MAFNYSDLNGAIVAKFGTQYNFAQALGDDGIPIYPLRHKILPH